MLQREGHLQQRGVISQTQTEGCGRSERAYIDQIDHREGKELCLPVTRALSDVVTTVFNSLLPEHA
jgi:hypothetical protein